MHRNLLLFFLLALSPILLNAQTYNRTGNGVKVNTPAGFIQLQLFSPAVIRVIKSPVGQVSAQHSLSVIAKPAAVKFSVNKYHGILRLTTSEIQIRIDPDHGQVSYYTIAGKLLMAESPHGATFLPVKDIDNQSYEITQQFQLPQHDAIYGLGQHQQGIMNYRNHSEVLRQTNMEIAVPFITTSRGYGLFWDNASLTHFKDTVGVTSLRSAAGHMIDYYFIYGGNADGVIAGMRMLTGNAPMFPQWVFGFWQSRERYTSQQQLIDVIKKYRELKVPLDGIVQDWQYWGIGDSVWNAVKFGNPQYFQPQQMTQQVHNLHAHMIISVWPNFGPKTAIYQEFKGMLFNFKTWPETPGVKVYDAFNPHARDIYWDYMDKNLFKAGIDGWWLDATEPEQGTTAQSDSAKTYLGTFKSLRNAYPLATTGGVYQHQRQADSSKRVFILTRSAYAGQQRYGTMTWSGDIQGTWDVLRKQISGGLNLSLSGIPYWNTDIGGFYSGVKYPKGVADSAFHELYTRWFEFAAFTPMFRSHGTNTPREIYQFGKKGDWAFDAQRKFIDLRYRLQPYIYSTAWQVTHSGSTIMRALAMDFAADTAVHGINNEYLFGKSVLVAPVTDSMYVSRAQGAAKVDLTPVKARQVYLPKTTDWLNFWTGKNYPGGSTINCEAPIDEIPLFVKAGSILPLGPTEQYTGEHKADPLEIRIYPGANGSFDLYEDAGDGYGYEHGQYTTIRFTWNNTTHTLTISSRKGNFADLLHNRTFNLVLVKPAQATGVAPGAAKNTIRYTGSKVSVVIR